jgi:hypothetical protein
VIKRLAAYIVGLMIVTYLWLFAYVIAHQGIEELVLCADDGGLKIPFSKSLCRKYLFGFRGNAEDIETLHQGIGASFVVHGHSSLIEREQILKYLIDKGLNVNHIDRHQLSALHGVVLANSVDEADMLLRMGANSRLKDQKFGLNPLELALKLQKENRLPADRQAMISLLQKNQAVTKP